MIIIRRKRRAIPMGNVSGLTGREWPPHLIGEVKRKSKIRRGIKVQLLSAQ